MNLPEEFLSEMRDLLGLEFEEFFASYEAERFYGLRLNQNKMDRESFEKIMGDTLLKKIPWTSDGYYYDGEKRPSKHPLYHAGVYYIQEPSAMSPVELLDVKEGHRVLDLCASPGGKTIQIASKLKGRGLLVTNDLNDSRINALLKNVELYGLTNAVVTNDSPKRLADNLEEYFNRILVDAPCSGEGMFRKDSSLIKSWEKTRHEVPEIQSEILQEAARMLKPGGKLVYSTCTFNRDENERQIEEFLKEHDDFEILEIPKINGLESGIGLDYSARLWPHKLEGEGHFLCLLRKKGEEVIEERTLVNREKPEIFKAFEEENLNVKYEGNFKVRKDRLYLETSFKEDVTKMKIVRNGLYLGEIKKNRFEPSQASAMAMKAENFKRVINFSYDDENVIRYLKGETISVEGEKGLRLICVEGLPLGYGKLLDGRLKNGYNPAWRMIG